MVLSTAGKEKVCVAYCTLTQRDLCCRTAKDKKQVDVEKKGTARTILTVIVSEGSPVPYQCHLARQLITMRVGHLKT